MMTRTLDAVAAGQLLPDLVIVGGRIFSMYSERIIEGQEIWIKDGRIAALKPAGSYLPLPGDRTLRYDARGGMIAPGLVDPQVNLASSLMSACAYAEAALLNGTTTILVDCEEVAAVCEGRNFRWFLADARRASLSVYAKVPVRMFAREYRAAAAEEMAKVFHEWPEVRAQAEVADYISPVAAGVDDMTEDRARGRGDDALEAAQWVFLRCEPSEEGAQRLARQLGGVAELSACAKRLCLCTDQRDANELSAFGLDWMVRQAVAAGVPPATAWSLASLNPAMRFALDGEVGGLGPTRRADLVMLNDALEVQNTWYGGVLVVENKKITSVLDRALSKPYHYPKEVAGTVRIPRTLKLVPELPVTEVVAKVIGVGAPSAGLESRRVVLPVARSWGGLLTAHRLCFVSSVRFGSKAEAGVAYGLLQDFGLVEGAVAGTVSAEAPGAWVVGVDEADMKVALAAVKKLMGGVCVVRGGAVVAELPLPNGGVLSALRGPDAAKQLGALKRAWAELGCTLSLADFCRLASGGLRGISLTPRGLLLVPEGRIAPLFEVEAGATLLPQA